MSYPLYQFLYAVSGPGSFSYIIAIRSTSSDPHSARGPSLRSVWLSSVRIVDSLIEIPRNWLEHLLKEAFNSCKAAASQVEAQKKTSSNELVELASTTCIMNLIYATIINLQWLMMENGPDEFQKKCKDNARSWGGCDSMLLVPTI